MGNNHNAEKKELNYPRLIHTELKNLEIFGKNLTKMGFLVSKPACQLAEIVMLEGKPAMVSGCILPGQDITDTAPKKCQDNYSFVIYQNTLMIMLFDGHGANGHFVANFCVDYFTQYYYKHFQDFIYDTQDTIKGLFLSCDEELKSSGINCDLSGSTCVLVILTSTHMHCASVGDSRGILISSNNANYYYSSQLTTDQKPNHKEEYHRIKAQGGSVRRFINESGIKRGPYRIWDGDSNIPGLAMSRSLGDFTGKSIGVIAAPIYACVQIHPRDKYVVIASDGVWDVMSNDKITEFLSQNFDKCCGETCQDYPGTVKNCTPARLICEEARTKWFSVTNIDRNSIDDITCIVAKISELNTNEHHRVVQFNCTMVNEEYCLDNFE